MRLPTPLQRLGDTQRTLWLAALAQTPWISLVLWRNVAPGVHDSLTALYALAAIVGYFVVPTLLVSAASGLLLGLWPRSARLVVATVFTLYLFFLVVDGQLFSIYKFHLNGFWLNFLVEDFQGLGIPGSMVAVATLVLGLLAALEGLIFWCAARWRPRRRWLSLVTAGLIVAGAAGQIIHVVAYEKNDRRITALTPRLPAYLPLRSHSNAVRFGDRLPGVEEEFSSLGKMRQSLRYPLHPLRFSPPPPPRFNVIVLLLESWRADSWGPSITPNIAAFAHENLVFDQHFSSGNSTVAGVVGLFYGIHPTYWEAIKADNVALHNPVMIDAFVEHGYELGIFAESSFERHKIKDAVFRDIEIHDRFQGKQAVTKDPDLTRQLLDFLRERDARDEPFFAFGFYKASHYTYSYDPETAPFHPAKRRNLALRADEGIEPYLNDYRNALHFEDEQVGRVLDWLRHSGHLEDTVVVITTDHAESFDDNGQDYWGHGSNFTRYQTQVPFFMHWPGHDARVESRRSSHLDLTPTLLRGVFGCTNPIEDYSDGRDLFDLPAAARSLVIAGYTNHALVLGDQVYESRPFGLKAYTLDDVTAVPPPPPLADLRALMHSIGRFYAGGANEDAAGSTVRR